MPPLRFLAPRPALVALAPVISFPDVPSIQFNDPGEGLIRQPQHLFNPLALAHLFVQLGTLLLRPLALATRLPIQGGTRQFDPGQPLDDRTGFARRHFAGDQCRHLLHRRRGAAFLAQAQGMIRGKSPGPAMPAPTPQPSDCHRPETGLIGAFLIAGLACQRVPTDRTHRRTLIGFLLRRFLQKLCAPTPAFVGESLLPCGRVSGP